MDRPARLSPGPSHLRGRRSLLVKRDQHVGLPSRTSRRIERVTNSPGRRDHSGLDSQPPSSQYFVASY